MRGPANTDEKILINITKVETLNVHMLKTFAIIYWSNKFDNKI